jgi:hypothetical protein
LTFANVVSVIALFVALGGSSYAALKVTGKNVKNSSLTGADVRNNSLTGADVKNIGTADIKNHSLLPEDLKDGQALRGGKGDKGDTGAQGSTGPSDVYYVTRQNIAHLWYIGNPTPTTVTSLSLPAGQFLVEAHLVLVNFNDFPTITRCHIRAGGTDFPSTASKPGVNNNTGENSPIEQMAMSAPLSLTAPDTAVLICTPDPILYSIRPYVESVRMYAIKTGNLVSTTDSSADPYP